MESAPITKIEDPPFWAVPSTITSPWPESLFNTNRVRNESPRNEYETYRRDCFLFLNRNKYRVIFGENERVILFLN